MLRSFVSLFILLYLQRGYCVEENNLGNALNSIENRQRLLTSNYYALSNKDSERGGYPSDDDSLMYLSDTSAGDDTPDRDRFLLGKVRTSANSYEDDYDPSLTTDEYQRALSERFVDQLVLDMLNSEGELPEQRAQKRSFFREREINEVGDNLQDVQSVLDADTQLKSTPYSPHRRVSQPSYLDEEDGSYVNALDPLWRKYDDGQRFPETVDRDELDAIFKYLADDGGRYEDDENDEEDDDYLREAYRNENRNGERDRSKRYWLGSQRPSQIRKRSTSVEEKPKTTNRTSDQRLNVTTAPPLSVTGEKTILKRDKKGQAEVPVDLESLKPLNIHKKSIDWSNYFGVDKRQKKSTKHQTQKESAKSDASLDQYIQSYILQSVRDSTFNSRGNDYGRHPKRTSGHREYSQMADDLKSAEDMIIDRVLKYTGAHQGVTDPQELRRYKERVINELSAAYNLEKLRNEINPDNQSRMKRQHMHVENKRVAVKKENARLSPAKVDTSRVEPNITKTHTLGSYNFLNSPTSRSQECHTLDKYIYWCSIISEREAADYNHVLVPACAFHSLCYICRETRGMCAMSFFHRASDICSENAVPHHCLDKAYKMRMVMKHKEETSSFARSLCEPCVRGLLSGEETLE